jgi:hypothetical protein
MVLNKKNKKQKKLLGYKINQKANKYINHEKNKNNLQLMMASTKTTQSLQLT